MIDLTQGWWLDERGQLVWRPGATGRARHAFTKLTSRLVVAVRAALGSLRYSASSNSPAATAPAETDQVAA
jgi:hypothetical protein